MNAPGFRCSINLLVYVYSGSLMAKGYLHFAILMQGLRAALNDHVNYCARHH